jgi:hypothetical protein
MPAIHTAHLRAATRPLRAFSITLCSAGHRIDYTALARSSGDALGDALSRPDIAVPCSASVKPIYRY